jgi:hypothetical protein
MNKAEWKALGRDSRLHPPYDYPSLGRKCLEARERSNCRQFNDCEVKSLNCARLAAENFIRRWEP